jgi:hypothetical protein
MNIRRLLLTTGGAIATAVLLTLAVNLYWERKQPVLQDAPRLSAALQAFCRDESANGQLPAEVSLQDLLKGGYVNSNDMRAFEGIEVTFSTHYDDGAPELILARALAPDGQSICLLADGSVQQLSARKYSDYLRQSRRVVPQNIGISNSEH